MNKWFTNNSDLTSSIETLYIRSNSDLTNYVSSTKFIILSNDNIITNRFVTYIILDDHETNLSKINIQEYYSIISSIRLSINITASRIHYIPFKGKLFYNYIHPCIIDYPIPHQIKQIISTKTYYRFKSQGLFNQLMFLLDINTFTDLDISYHLLTRTFIDCYYEVRNIDINYATVYKNNKLLVSIPNYFNILDNKLFEMLFVNIFYSDGIPILNNYKKSYFSQSGIFETTYSTPLMNDKAITIYNNFDNIESNKNYIVYSNRSSVSVLSYQPSYGYIALRNIISSPLINNHIVTVKSSNSYISRQYITPQELQIVYNHFKGTELFDHKFMNFMNFMCPEYEKYLYNYQHSSQQSVQGTVQQSSQQSSQQSDERIGQHSNDAKVNLREIFYSAKGMNWGINKKHYKLIDISYSKVLEAFGTKYNHFLDDYCDPINRSFFDETNKQLIEYDAYIINPPYTEAIIQKTLNLCYKLLYRTSNIILYIYLPMWYDLIGHLTSLYIIDKRIININMKCFDFENEKTPLVKIQLVILSNRKLTNKDRHIIETIVEDSV